MRDQPLLHGFAAWVNLSQFNLETNSLPEPFERIFGFALLGVQTVQTYNRLPFGFNPQF